MKITELFFGMGVGGAEVAALNRLAHAPQDVETSFVVAGEHQSEMGQWLAGTGSPHVVKCESTGSDTWEAIMRTEPDVLIVNTPRHIIQLAPRLNLARPFRAIAVAHGSVVSESTTRATLISLALSRANGAMDRHIAVSRAAAKGPWCRGARAVSVCHLGSSLQPLVDGKSAVWPAARRVRLLALSRLTKPKNLHRLVEAVARLRTLFRAQGAHLAVVGSGPERQRLTHLILKRKVSDIVALRGPTAAPADWLRGADWLLIPSTSEGGPLTLFEGLQTGIRILSTRCGAASDLLESDRESILTQGASVSDLTAGLRELLARDALSAPARARRRDESIKWSTAARSVEWYSILRSASNV